MYCHSINRPTISFLIWVNLVLPELFFFNAFIHHEFFFWSIFLHQMFFFCLQHGEILPLFIIIPSSFYKIPISRKDFKWGWGLSAVNFLLLHENLMLCQKQKIPNPKKLDLRKKTLKVFIGHEIRGFYNTMSPQMHH